MKHIKYVIILCFILLIIIPIVGTMICGHNEKLIEPLSETTKWLNLKQFGAERKACTETTKTNCCDITNSATYKYCGVGNLSANVAELQAQEKSFEDKMKRFGAKVKQTLLPKNYNKIVSKYSNNRPK